MEELRDPWVLYKPCPVTYIFSCFPSAYSLDMHSSRKEGKKEERVSLWMSWNCSRILSRWPAMSYFPRHWTKGQQLCSVAYWMRSQISFHKMKHSAWDPDFKGLLQQLKNLNFSFQHLLVFWNLSLSFNPNGNLSRLKWIPLICTKTT